MSLSRANLSMVGKEAMSTPFMDPDNFESVLFVGCHCIESREVTKAFRLGGNLEANELRLLVLFIGSPETDGDGEPHRQLGDSKCAKVGLFRRGSKLPSSPANGVFTCSTSGKNSLYHCYPIQLSKLNTAGASRRISKFYESQAAQFSCGIRQSEGDVHIGR